MSYYVIRGLARLFIPLDPVAEGCEASVDRVIRSDWHPPVVVARGEGVDRTDRLSGAARAGTLENRSQGREYDRMVMWFFIYGWGTH